MIYCALWMAIGATYNIWLLRKHGRSWSTFAARLDNRCDDLLKPLLALLFACALLIVVALWPVGLLMRLFGGWGKAGDDR